MDSPVPPSDIPGATVSVFKAMPARSWPRPAGPVTTPADTDLPGWVEHLKAAGVNAHRIASPALLEQLRQALTSKIDTIICSILDTDPSVPFNAAIADSFKSEMAAGMKLLLKLTSATRVWITADPDKTSAWFSAVSKSIKTPGVRLVPLRGDYPQTDPTLMLYTLLNRRLSPGMLPTARGAILLDAAAAVAVGRCALTGFACQTTELAIRDHFQQKTHFLSIPVGTTLGEVCDYLEIGHPDAVYRAGDFLRDQWITRDTPLGSGELVIHATAQQLDANPDPCIHCGWCLEACPTRIHPAGLLDAAQLNDVRLGKKYGMDACIECGICSYVCPTRLPLLSAIRVLKSSA